jgi:hypothetical protein
MDRDTRQGIAVLALGVGAAFVLLGIWTVDLIEVAAGLAVGLMGLGTLLV